MKKILLLGAYGQKNIGDEALLEASLKILNKNNTPLIYSNSMTPKESMEEYKGVNFFHTNIRTNFFNFFKIFLKSDFIIYGGGSLLVELKMNKLNKRTPLIRMFILNLIGKILKKKIIFLGIGAEYVSEGFSSFLMKYLLKYSDIIYVRDNFSKEVVLFYGAKSENTHIIPDIVHSLPGIHHSREDKSTYNICIIPVCRVPEREKNYTTYIDSLGEFIINEITKGNSITLCGMRFEESDELNDRKAIEDIIAVVESKKPGIATNIITILKYLSPKIFAETISKFDMVYSSRFHGLIYSINSRIPCISLSNFAKSKYVLEEANLGDYSLSEKNMGGKKLIELQERMKNNYDTLSESIGKIKTSKDLLSQEQLKYLYSIL